MRLSSNEQRVSGMPNAAETYEGEYGFWPWGMLLSFVADWIEKYAPANATVLDYMCGTGYLLNIVAQRRQDLRCFGCSLTPEYIHYAKRKYTKIQVDLCDAREYQPATRPDIVVCTAGLHHLPWNSQESFLQKVASELTTGKTFLLGEELIRRFTDEKERRMAVIEMNTEVLKYMTEKQAPANILVTAADVLKADLAGLEYKIDKATIENMLSSNFQIDDQIRFWPENEQGYGDHVFICQRR